MAGIVRLRLNWYDDEAYLLTSDSASDSYQKFEDLVYALADYLGLGNSGGILLPPCRLQIYKRARDKLGDKAVSILELIVKHHNMIVKARKELGDVED